MLWEPQNSRENMSLNLNKHGQAMQKAWKAVLDPNDDTNWALFGYEGNTFDLKLVGSGEDGIEELAEDLNANKIMYAFLQVDDPKTSLPKYVLLNWQGESAPGTRKGLCATHLRDVNAYFRGAHLTYNARTEDEVNEEDIKAQVAKASASSYNFKEKPMAASEAPVTGPIGSNHERINPEKELPKLSEREKFWNEEQAKEKQRIEQERSRKISEQTLLDKERRDREAKEAKLRDQAVTERERKISQIREKEKQEQDLRSKEEQARWEKAQETERREQGGNKSDLIRQERNEETKKLISQRSADAKAVFERNSSAGQMNYRRQSSSQSGPPPQIQMVKEEEKVPEPQAAPKAPEPVPQPPSPEPPSPVKEPAPPSPAKEPEPIPESPPSPAEFIPPPPIFGNEEAAPMGNGSNAVPDLVSKEPSSRPDIIQDVPNTPDITANVQEKPEAQGNGVKDLGICAVALYDYQAADETEVTFDPGHVITNIDQIDPGWWQGLGPDGSYGLFPANYVEVIDAKDVEAHRAASK